MLYKILKFLHSCLDLYQVWYLLSSVCDFICFHIFYFYPFLVLISFDKCFIWLDISVDFKIFLLYLHTNIKWYCKIYLLCELVLNTYYTPFFFNKVITLIPDTKVSGFCVAFTYNIMFLVPIGGCCIYGFIISVML